MSELIAEKRILLCVGGGGVGKTTISATLGVAAALRGRRTAVLTIDPARRLKDSLAIPDLGSEPVRVDLATLGAPAGELTAMMLDAKRTFDQLVARFAPSLDAAEEILANRLYQFVSGRLAGAQEYMALEKLYEIATAREYDLLVVDTPPTHHALDFLDAPQRMIDLLGSRAVEYLQRPSLALLGFGSKVAQAALETILRGLERFTGLKLLAEVADFVSGFEGMVGGFQARADAVRRLLRDPKTAAVLVTSAEPLSVREALSFHRELTSVDLDVGGVVVNRIVPPSLVSSHVDKGDPDLPEALCAKLLEARRELEQLARRDERMIDSIDRTLVGRAALATVPAFASDLSSLEDLGRLAELLVPESPRRNGARRSAARA